MRSIPQRILTYLLVVAYGGASLLGYGLHMLSAHDHHHHGVGLASCDHHHGGHGHDHHGCSTTCESACGDEHSVGLSFSSIDGDSHECDICNFLAQARSVAPQVAAEIVWQHLVTAAPVPLPIPYQGTILSPHAARGPPHGLV